MNAKNGGGFFKEWELDDLGGCSGLPVFTFHKDGGSQISPQLPEISKVDPVFVQIQISFPRL